LHLNVWHCTAGLSLYVHYWRLLSFVKTNCGKKHCVTIIVALCVNKYIYIKSWHFTFVLQCVVIDFFLNNQPGALIIQILFCYKTLHVSAIFSATHASAFIATTWISYRCVPCHPWCTHRTSLVAKKNFFGFPVAVNNSIKVGPSVLLL
jgi:hypothetical protein